MQDTKDFNGAELFTLTKQGKLCGMAVRRDGHPDLILDGKGMAKLSEHLSTTGQELSNAVLSSTGGKPKDGHTIRSLDVAEVRTPAEPQPKPQPAPQPQPAPPKPPGPTPAQILKYRHTLCEAAIKFLYGADADTAAHKVYYGKENKYADIKGVDITSLDYTTPELFKAGKVSYSKKVWDALPHLRFTKSEQHGGAYIHNAGGGVLFRAYTETKAQGLAEHSVLFFDVYSPKK